MSLKIKYLSLFLLILNKSLFCSSVENGQLINNQLIKGVAIGVGGILLAQRIYTITQAPHYMNQRAVLARINVIHRVSATYIQGLRSGQSMSNSMRDALTNLLTESADTIRRVYGASQERQVTPFLSVEEINDFSRQLPQSWPGWVSMISYQAGMIFRRVTMGFGYGMMRGR